MLPPIAVAEDVAEDGHADRPEQRPGRVVEGSRGAGSLRPTPAITGVKVRTTGTNRASTTAFGPWRSKNSWVRSTYSCLEQTRIGAAEQRRADPLADQISELGAEEGGHERARQEQPELELALPGEHPGGEQQRVAGEEEPHQQAGLRRR